VWQDRPSMRLPARPERDVEGVLEAGERDDVDERTTGEQVMQRRAVQLGCASEAGDRLATVIDLRSKRTGDVRDLRDTDWGIGADGAVGEPLDVVGGPEASRTRHAPPYHGTAGETRTRWTNTCSGGQTGVGVPPHPSEKGKSMWDRHISTEVGRRVHLVVALALVGGWGQTDVVAAVRELFRADPLGGHVAGSLRTRCASLANVYVGRCVPEDGWVLVGVEERFPGTRADLVWLHVATGMVVIDELKCGRTDLTNARTARQARALVTAGHQLWAGRFGGVRVVTLGLPERSWMVAADHNGQMRRVSFPPGLAVR
jgi:hypothetical protein